jgi:hypothetical protein
MVRTSDSPNIPEETKVDRDLEYGDQSRDDKIEKRPAVRPRGRRFFVDLFVAIHGRTELFFSLAARLITMLIMLVRLTVTRFQLPIFTIPTECDQLEVAVSSPLDLHDKRRLVGRVPGGNGRM